MKNTFFNKINFIILLSISVHGFLAAEPFRVAKTHIINLPSTFALDESETTSSLKMGMNDSIAIFLPETTETDNLQALNYFDFVEGLELKISIPEDIAVWRDCCACSIYENINPTPEADTVDYDGEKIFFTVLPGKLSWILQVPFKKDNAFKTNQYTQKIDRIPDLSNNYIFFRLQQIMKGVPDEVLNKQIKVAVRPILADKGMLSLSVNKPSEQLSDSSQYAQFSSEYEDYSDEDDSDEDDSDEEYEDTEEEDSYNQELQDNNSNGDAKNYFTNLVIYIDEQQFSLSDSNNNCNVILPSGLHNLTIISDDYRTEVRTVRIEQSKISEISVDLKSIEPTLIITAPEGTDIYFDENKLDVSSVGKELIISEGDHKIKFRFGNYEILRSISAIKGKTYKANLTLDLDVSEE